MKNKLTAITVLCTAIVCSGCANNSKYTWLNHDRRTNVTVVDDQAISSKATLMLTKNKDLWKDSHISILSYNKSLLLVGQTPKQQYIEEINKLVEQISELEVLYNEMSVSKPLPIKSRAKDAWITTQVKARIISNRSVGPNRVKVVTEDSVVYLMGILTKEEEKTVADIASRISGVERVVTFQDNIKRTQEKKT